MTDIQILHRTGPYSKPEDAGPHQAGSPPLVVAMFHRLREAVRPRRTSLLVLTGLLLVAGLVQGANMDGAPQRIDDEGTYVAQAWAVLHLGELTHYTYWYDHPPLGWLQIAGYAQLTGAFDRYSSAVSAGREFMLVVQLASVVLLWMLTRRLGFSRWASALAVGMFSLSPLAVQFHRTVYLDNIATPWFLAACVLALSPGRRLAAFSGAGLCFAVAVLTKETSLLLLPVVGWLIWTRSRGETRRYAVAVSGALFLLALSFYVLFALIKGELVPGANRTSLVGGVLFQLADRASSGNVFATGTLADITLRQWLRLDVVLPLLALAATAIGLTDRRLRPFAVGFTVLLIMIVRPGYLPVPFVIVMLPLAVVLVAGVADLAWQRRLSAVAAGLVGALALAFAAPAWSSQLEGFTRSDANAPMNGATAWVRDNLPRDSRILTDDALWVDLVDSGFDRRNVVWFYKPDTDPAVVTGWRNYGWVISTDSMRTFPTSFATVTGALTNSDLVARFGQGDERVEIRKIRAPGSQSVDQLRQQPLVLRTAGRELASNPALTLSKTAASALRSGLVDGRMLTLLSAATAGNRLQISTFPVDSAEPGPGPRRQVEITGINGAPIDPGAPATRELIGMLAGQSPQYRPSVHLVGAAAATRLVVSFPLIPR